MSLDSSRSREQLIQELGEVRSQLAAKEHQCQELSQELFLLKSKKLPESERLVRKACLKLTERKQAAAALQESENRYRELVQNANSAIIRWSREGMITFFNEYAQEFFGWSAEEVIGQHVSILVPDRESSGADLTGLAQDVVDHPDRYVNNINENICKDGRRVWLTWTNRALRNEDGQVAEILAIGSDITARKQAEEALRRLSEYPEKNPNPVLRVAANGTLLYANAPARNWLATLGWQSDGPLPAAVLAIVGDAHGKAHAVQAEISDPNAVTFWVSAVQPSGEDFINLYGIDITERERAEVALRENEKRWAVTLASIGDAVIATDMGGRLTFMNKVAERLTGWSMADAAGKPVQEVFRIVNEYTRATVEDPVSKVIQTGLIVGLANHTVLLRKGGGEIPIDDSGAPIRDEEGRIFGVVLTFRDIIERKRAEEALQESEERVRRKLESVLSPEGDLGELELADLIDAPALQKLMADFYAVARIPMSILDVKGRVVVGVGWQDICTRFHRVQPDTCRNCLESDTRLSAELAQGGYRLYKCKNNLWDMAAPIMVAGQHVGNIFTGQFFFEDETVDREFFGAQAREFGFDEEEYLAALDRVPRLSRETVDRGMSFFLKLSDTLSQLGYSNVKLARLLAERDRLTDSLRESQEKLKAAMGSMTDAVFISDSDGRFIDFNDAFATFHRFTNKDECSKTFAEYPDILDVFMANGKPAPLDQWAVPRALRGESVTNAEYSLRRKDTGETWVGSYSFGPIRDKNGVIVGSVVVGRDITERKQAEESLRQLNETLEQRVAERTELAEARARQLQALAMDLIEAEERERRRIADLLHDDLQQILAAARMQLQAVCETIPPEPMLASVEQLLEESIGKSRRLSHELSPAVLQHSGLAAALKWLAEQMMDQFGLHVRLESNAAQQFDNAPLRVFLFRSVQELLFNVVKHSGVKSAQVVLSGSDGSLAVTVSDQGRGFNPDILESYTATRGFGLLSLRERVRYIGGNLLIETSPGQGSRFTLTVPIRQAGAIEIKQPAADRQPRTQAGSSISAGIGDIMVLFVDDHAIMRQGLMRLLTGQPNIRVVGEAANGREAIERVRQLKPDVVVMDVSMPEMDGIEATRHIKAEFPEVRVIGLSMYQEEQIANSMREAGAEAFVTKTASPAELLEAIYGFNH